MSLVFAGIVPHSPLLMPSVGKDNTAKLQATVTALEKIEQELYASKPDTIVVISPHGVVLFDSFLLNVAAEYTADLGEFGDFTTSKTYHGDLRLAEALKATNDGQLPLTATSETKLDHGTAIPLFLLTKHLPEAKILPISYCLLDYSTHYRFGQLLKEQILHTNQRIAVLASGDLSHRSSKDSPSGYWRKAKEFDQRIVEAITQRRHDELLALDPTLVEKANECGLRSIIILLGILAEINYRPMVLSYEAPFGVGHLTAVFELT